MSTSNKILSMDELRDRIRIKQAAAESADSSIQATDPTDKGTVKAKSDPSSGNDKLGLPANASNTAAATSAAGGKTIDANDPTDKGTVTAKSDPSSGNDKLGLPANAANADISKQATSILQRMKNIVSTKSATQPQPDVNPGLGAKLASSQDMLAQLGQAVLEVEGGIEYARSLIEKKAGMDVAATLIENAKIANQSVKQAAEVEKQLEHFMKHASAEEIQQLQQAVMYDQFIKNASAEERQMMTKLATVHNSAKGKLRTDLEKRAYDQGAADAALMADAAEGGQLPAEGEMPEPSIEEVMMVLEQLVQSGQIDPATAEQLAMMLSSEGGEVPSEGGDSEPSMEAILMALEQLVQEGQLDPATAEQIASTLVAEDPAAQGMPVAPEEIKAASLTRKLLGK